MKISYLEIDGRMSVQNSTTVTTRTVIATYLFVKVSTKESSVAERVSREVADGVTTRADRTAGANASQTIERLMMQKSRAANEAVEAERRSNIIVGACV